MRAVLVLALLLPSLALAAPARDLQVALDPAGHRVKVLDTVQVGTDGARSLRFLLHATFEPETASPGVVLEELRRPPRASDFGLTGERFQPPTVPVKLWEVTLPQGASSFALAYAGLLDHPVQPVAEEQARGFAETPGTIGEDGVFLTGAAFWVASFGGGTFPFRLAVDLPAGWDAVSQGGRAAHVRGESAARVVWECGEPQAEVVLLAGRFVETARRAGKVETFTFLREKDDALAARYLDATERYLRMYEDLLGPYPYPKFALVENFWETGYGFPSFTALGSKVIRLPFLLQSSYPHEILHDWWGNGVFVDPSEGNWSEGLTAYLADHLLQEQSGDASGYRQEALQRYTDYVTGGKDFPLQNFRERHSPASEAVGYGKAMMLFHEVRRALGDEAFLSGLRRFYTEQRFREAGFGALRRALEAASGRDLQIAFAQALTRTGAPQLAVREAAALQESDGWHVRGVLAQVQPGKPYVLDVPVAVTLEGVDAVFETRVPLEKGTAPFDLKVPGRPVRVDVDPAFDLFRRLDPGEVPPALSGALGAERVLAVLPASAAPPLQQAYRTLVQALAPEPGRVELRSDADLAALPTGRTVWVLGWENRFVPEVGRALAPYGAQATGTAVSFPELARPRTGLAAVAVTRGERDGIVTWLAADGPEQVPGLARKLPHYGKYSWLAFEGNEPANVGKGRWPSVRSPLTASLAPGALASRAALARRAPLAVPPPEVATEPLAAAVRTLAAPEMDGRGPGTEGHARAVAFVSAQLRAAGLTPVADDGNVVGTLAGSRKDWRGQVVVVGAHLDHLGRPGGVLHPGGDDNASGVAALLALARAFAAGPPPERTIVFAAFDQEEAGRVGSKRLAAKLAAGGATVFAMVNLDTVGRLGERKLLVLGTGTAAEWPHVFRGAGFVTGVPVEPVAADPGGSDQLSFQELGIPAVQLFTGPHTDYHTAGDTADKVDVPGIAKVVAVAREAVAYLAARPEPLTRAGAEVRAAGEGGARKVALGTIPDFAYAGAGVRLEGVVAGSAAERGGLLPGDVLVELNGQAVADLRAYSDALKRLSPGERVRLTYVRAGERKTAEVEAAAR
ncbi:MAG TPA: M28 family peptidase [Candidatus Polarisedimenticolaceae bacterium]|nr:M28 family peptidase [Candidatus Polarisedimenticolaceae bacterium]